MGRGRFIVFEGIDGSGKTTQMKLFSQRLKADGMSCCETREPTDGPVGALVNQILKKRLAADEAVTAALFAGDRLDHLLNQYNGICSKVEQGIHVVSDRYYLSSYAYNGSKVPLDWVMKLNEQAARILRPDAHIFVDVLPELAVRRILDNRFETELYETTENLRMVREQFFQVFELVKNEENIIVVDGSGTPEEIAEEIWSKTKAILNVGE